MFYRHEINDNLVILKKKIKNKKNSVTINASHTVWNIYVCA